MDISSDVNENTLHNKYRSYWRIESGLRIFFAFNDQEMPISACDMTIEIQDIELEIHVMHFRNTISDPEKLITYTLGDDENELTISKLQTIMIDLKDKVQIEINEERLRFTNHGKYVVDSDSQTILITASEEGCLRFLEEYSYIERLPKDNNFINESTVPSIPVMEAPIGEVIPIELCKAPFFRDCSVINLGFEETWLEEDYVVKSIKIPLIPENRAINVTSNLGKTYCVQNFLVDSDLSDGQSQLDLYLETENGTSIKILKYIRCCPVRPGEVIKQEPLEEEGTERPPPKAVTYHRQEVTDKPIVVVPLVMEALLNNNTIVMTPSEGQDESEDGEEKEETLNTFKPQLNDAVLPIKSIQVKEKEYTENRDKPNLLGYFTYNGFFDVGVSKSKIKKNKKKKESEQGESETEKIEEHPMNQGIDQDSFVEAIKAFQRFNAFPETGEISENEAEVMTSERCGNRDTSFKDEMDAFKCEDGEGVIESDNNLRENCILDNDSVLNICTQYPNRLADGTRNAIWENNDNYYFEFDVEFGAKSKPQSHIGIAFNHNQVTRQSIYVMVIHERQNERLSFSYGIYSRGRRKAAGRRPPYVYFDHDQRIAHRFKIRLTVKPKKASIAVNGKRVFEFITNLAEDSSVVLFSLGGSNYINHKIKILTSRICTRNKNHASNRGGRAKRYALSNFRWYPNGKPITYTFLNHSSNLGKFQV